MEFEFVECRSVCRVGCGQEQAVGAFEQGQYAMLAQQLRVDKIPRTIRKIKRVEIEQRSAVFL